MTNALARLSRLLVVLAALALAGSVQLAAPVAGADALLEIAALSESVAPVARPAVPRQQMTQFRCPGGQLVFLTRACGCNGACCACARNTPYLNHCTCRCEAAPSSCTKGHSAGNP